MKQWQRDLGYLRLLGPDLPDFDAATQRVWDRIEDLERTLQYYAQRRNYRPPAGNTTHDVPLGGWMERNDSYDGDGAGARARKALS